MKSVVDRIVNQSVHYIFCSKDEDERELTRRTINELMNGLVLDRLVYPSHLIDLNDEDLQNGL